MEKDRIKEYTAGDITIWLLLLKETKEAELDRMYRLCDEMRREKTDKIKLPEKRRQSIGAGYLLHLLKKKFSIEEEPVILSGGKPVFQGNGMVHFNVSHARDAAALAFGKRPLGVDIEYVKRANLKVAERFFSEEECACLFGENDKRGREYERGRGRKEKIKEVQEEEDAAEQADVFCRIWTGKEAVVKAAGCGLTVPLDTFSVLGERVIFSEKSYELYQQRCITGDDSMWISVAQLITDKSCYSI